MGVDFYCGDKTFGCSYGGWNELRKTVIKSTFDYIQDKFQKDFELYNSINDEEDEYFIGEGSIYNCYKKYINTLQKLITDTVGPKILGISRDDKIGVFIRTCQNLNILNALNYFELGGLFALCNQSDCEGYYTPGNSLDICSLFDTIQPFVKKYDCYDCIYTEEGRLFNRLYDVFEYSHKTLKKISIA
jgi:hypothetical protein